MTDLAPNAFRLGRDAIGLDPLLPPPLLAGLAGLCLLAIGLGLWRRAAGTGWRGLGVAVLLGWLAGPVLWRQSWRTLPETLLLVVDRTGSMTVGRRQAVADAATARLREQAAALPGIDVRTVSVPPDPDGGTRLLGAIGRAAAAIPAADGGSRIAAVVAVTDGEVHDLPQPGATVGDGGGPTLPGPDVPLQVLIPAAGEEVDRRLRVLQAPPFAIVGQTATVRVVVEDLGPAPANGRAVLTIRRDGEAPERREVTAGVPQDIAVPVTRPGPMLLSIDASALPGEVSTANNGQVVRIDGVRDRLRVLLVSGAPNQGERVWRRLLKADPAVDLVHFTILRPPDKDDATPLNELALIAFPIRELFQDKIDQFDLIILDGFENRGILPMGYLRNIADFVRGGGGLLLTAGPELIGPGSLQDTPLGEVLPVKVPEDGGLVEAPFQPMPTALGRRHPVLAGLPQMPPADAAGTTAVTAAGHGWGDWYRALRADPGTLDPSAEVLLDGPGGPLLVLDRMGRGRVAMLLSDQLWLWSRGENGGGPQAELLRRLAHWLMKEPELEEERLSAAIAGGVLTATRASVAGSAAATATVVAPDGTSSPLPLSPLPDGGASGSIAAAAPGIWQVRLGDERAFAAARPADPLELSDLRATATLLRPLARRSGGGVHWLGDDPDAVRTPALRLVGPHAAASGADWIGLRRHGAHAVTGERATVLLPAALALPLALAALLFGWWREGGGRRKRRPD